MKLPPIPELSERSKFSITIGTLVAIVGVLIAGVTKYNRIDATVAAHTMDIAELKAAQKLEEAQKTDREVRIRLLEEQAKQVSQDLHDIKQDLRTLTGVRSARGVAR